jgi:hypothetical protein
MFGRENTSLLYLIDFGLSMPYVTKTKEGTLEHAKPTFIEEFTGNFMFNSMNSCRGFNKSRRDDIESALYLIIFLLNNNSLPWSNVRFG